MEMEQKKARIYQIKANKVLRRSRPCKEPIAMINTTYIATNQELVHLPSM
jgi:hypothetical protein